MKRSAYHEPVLAAQVTDFLVLRPGIYIDGTLGGGGHALAIMRALETAGFEKNSLLIGIDQDDEALHAASTTLSWYKETTVLVKGNFSDVRSILGKVCKQRGLVSRAAGILLDLGVSSSQIDTAGRGFSYLQKGPLDMRMDRCSSTTAADIVNTLDEKELAGLFFRYGEEPRSRMIARHIVNYREQTGAVTGTEVLAAIIRNAERDPHKQIKTLSRVFQALRIEVNQELEVLKQALSDGVDCLDYHGRMAVISYHSLEDRIVKSFFVEKSKSDWGPKGVGMREPLHKGVLGLVTRKPLIADEKEIQENPRARSAKLRVVENVATGGSHAE
ncbi:16S rRNA (cytosine(1402)-N(4))-methyltransferase RsmH [Chlorobium phaeobacteroides]|uniref:Ribosomal RNA small subunit methyltransferase H n=1 Tax=Chlorobium phaeobacteroides (strain DSM 266 / SMG 266 / 2430) TaxID=290317 RepID=RSMH_CHLPD|nr:16S rRNA (cytosine(1402)-N(4))-methyltransferase RsmH [Chlorobium phaeobacteroides]A1BJY6.1 RecName: Full=Ribosomal RNA small subunit methyltransferase H; AltName: Full=16S rRNA m(4)C1402 methyltransferase; AltName: Full=rRNA (cytosine-N(4)-)-methyltransferase RsmH [Chlorobium phaeobacteroides DSM 266]ABL66713.1 S-adenosyl-methyltransferase MraW [Chlorobium phaeobacteroides DSM 266]